MIWRSLPMSSMLNEEDNPVIAEVVLAGTHPCGTDSMPGDELLKMVSVVSNCR